MIVLSDFAFSGLQIYFTMKEAVRMITYTPRHTAWPAVMDQTSFCLGNDFTCRQINQSNNQSTDTPYVSVFSHYAVWQSNNQPTHHMFRVFALRGLTITIPRPRTIVFPFLLSFWYTYKVTLARFWTRLWIFGRITVAGSVDPDHCRQLSAQSWKNNQKKDKKWCLFLFLSFWVKNTRRNALPPPSCCGILRWWCMSCRCGPRLSSIRPIIFPGRIIMFMSDKKNSFSFRLMRTKRPSISHWSPLGASFRAAFRREGRAGPPLPSASSLAASSRRLASV